MVSALRNSIANLLIKAAFPNKANGHLTASVNSLLTLDYAKDKFVYKISVKSLNALMVQNGFKNEFELKHDNDVEIKQFSGENYYVFNLSNHDLLDQVLCKVEEPLALCDNAFEDSIIVEYSSPNIAKPFHMGHLRSTVIGQFVANIMSNSHKVIRMNYLGDWGTQFGLVQAGLENMALDIDNLKANPLRVINEAYVKANKDDTLIAYAKEISSMLEKENDSKELDVWKKLKELTINHLKETYKILGIEFDEYTWESQYAKGFSPILEKMKSQQLIDEVNKQLVVLRGEKRIPLMKSDGTSLYLSRDILAALDRLSRHKCTSMKYVIDKSQEEHVDTLRYVISKLTGSDIIEHIKFGKIIGMSTRKGSSIFLSDILEKATQSMAKQQQKSPNTRDESFETTQSLAISALIVYLLKQRRTKDFTFDWDVALQSKGDTGVKLQYTHSRLCSLGRNCGETLPTSCDPCLISEPDAVKLITLLERYDQVISQTKSTLESSFLVNYLLKLSNTTSLCLKKLPLKGENKDLAQQRLLLFHNVKIKLKSGMLILGLNPLEKM